CGRRLNRERTYRTGWSRTRGRQRTVSAVGDVRGSICRSSFPQTSGSGFGAGFTVTLLLTARNPLRSAATSAVGFPTCPKKKPQGTQRNAEENLVLASDLCAPFA